MPGQCEGMDIVDKIAGTDWTPKERSEFMLKYAETTKYQSPTRRVIAVIYVLQWIILVNSWLAACAYGWYFNAPDANALANDIKMFMNGNINVAMNGILAFYFLIGVKK